MKIVRIFLLLTGCLFASNSVAYDLLEAYQLAVKNDASLAAASFQSNADSMVKEIELAEVYPSLKIGVSGRESRNTGKDPNSKRYAGSIAIEQPLWRPAISIRTRQAGDEVEVAKIRYRKAENDLMLRVVSAYFELLASLDNLETQKNEVIAIQNLYDTSVSRHQVGIGTLTDVNNAKARLDSARASVIVSESSVRSAQLALSAITGTSAKEIDRLKDEVALPSPTGLDLHWWIDTAKSNNLDIAIQKKAVAIAEAGIDLASVQSQFAWTLELGAKDDFGSANPDKEKSYLSIVASKSFSAGGLATKQKKQARLRHQSQIELLRAVQTQVVTNITNAYLNEFSLADRVAALESAFNASEIARTAIDESYAAGLSTSLDVLNAQQDLSRVTRDLNRTKYDFLQSTIRIKHITGTLELADMEALNFYLN